MLDLWTVFHLNLLYSSIEEDQHDDVLERCYWPLLRLAREYELPLGIEAPGLTLERIAELDPSWIAELRRLVDEGCCELVGSGYGQVIGPLVPAAVTRANLRLGHNVYERLVGVRPKIALVNEQAYSSGLVPLYREAGYHAIVMEWDNPSSAHVDWNSEWGYLPQLACGPGGETIPVIWNRSIAFQKFQRYAHGEMQLAEILKYLGGHSSNSSRTFALYGNDVEVFDFRPGRYDSEARHAGVSEWRRLGELFEALQGDDRFRLVPPSRSLGPIDSAAAGHRLWLESSRDPVPVKKQGKYNLTRWAVTGRDDLGINTACHEIYESLHSRGEVTDDDWRELCFLWSSDFRTHITDARWTAFRKRLDAFRERVRPAARTRRDTESPVEDPDVVENRGRFLTITSKSARVKLNCRRGLAVESLSFAPFVDERVCGTLSHGYYDDIAYGADFYTGHLVLEAPGQAKVTDLSEVEPSVVQVGGPRPRIEARADVPTALGPVRKTVRLYLEERRLEIEYELRWKEMPPGSLRLGFVTLDPAAFRKDSLFFRTHNGGTEMETFPWDGSGYDHGQAVSFLVSARQGVGMTEGLFEMGDAERSLRVEVDLSLAAVVGLVTCRPVGASYFFRLALSAGEMDETCRPGAHAVRRFRVAITPGSGFGES